MALLLVMILLVASIRIFVWLNERIVIRQVRYEDTRIAAGSTTHENIFLGDLDNVDRNGLQLRKLESMAPVEERLVNESGFEDLNIIVKLN